MPEQYDPWDQVAGHDSSSLGPNYALQYIFLPSILAFLQTDFVGVGDISFMRLLDLGSGNGLFSLQIATNYEGSIVLGVDSSERMIEIARNNVNPQQKGIKISFEKEDATNLSLESGSFGIVLQIMLLQTVDDEDLMKIISETNRVLKPNGVCYVAIPNPAAISRFRNLVQAKFFDESMYNEKLDYQWRDPEDPTKIIATTGFYVRRIQYYVEAFKRHGLGLRFIHAPRVENTEEAYDSKPHVFLSNVFDPMFIILKFAKSGPEGLQLDKNEG